ncbi:MAG: LacI family DNA-binding transcriptional regulator [Clostridia bacterium]
MTESSKVTRKDVAKEAGVSVTIVSYVVNNNRYVDADKRRRVEEAVKKLRYTPNPIARSLKGKSSYHIMFIADKIDNEHFGKLVREMDNYAYDKGYLISLCANRNDDDFIRKILSRQVDGVIINSISFSEDYIKKIIHAGIPVVLFKNKTYSEPLEGVCALYSGLYSGAKDCVKRLCEKGCKSVMYIDRISTHNNFSDLSDLRLKGYYDGLKENGLEFNKNDIISGCHEEQEVIDKVIARLRDGGKVDAIFGRNDHMALLAMSAAKKAGYNVPRDIMIIGFDNSIASQLSDPTLTTVEIDRAGLGKEAVKMLMNMVAKKEPYKKEFKTTFIERESTMRE